MSTPVIHVRSLASRDITGVQALIADSFTPELHPYMTATQAGAGKFLAAFALHPLLFPERVYLLAESDVDELLGYAEFRLLDGEVGFLSYICVAPAARGQGVATRLINHYLRQSGVRRMALDVFSRNEPAIRLYQKLGFVESGRTMWWVRSLADGSPSAPLRIDNLPQALAMQELYGFCEVQGQYAGQPFKVGLMGTGVLRCFDPADFENADLQRALRAIWPELREALLISGEEFSPARAVNCSLRLTWDAARPPLTILSETP